MKRHVETQSSAPASDAISWDTALQLCAAIQAENQHKWYTSGGMMCRGCVTFSRGNLAKRCFANRPDNRGCYQVNARYDQQSQATSRNPHT